MLEPPCVGDDSASGLRSLRGWETVSGVLVPSWPVGPKPGSMGGVTKPCEGPVALHTQTGVRSTYGRVPFPVSPTVRTGRPLWTWTRTRPARTGFTVVCVDVGYLSGKRVNQDDG